MGQAADSLAGHREGERAYDWYETDTFLTAAAAQNLKVLVSVVTAPDWSREQGADLAQHGPPANPQDYADFVAALLRRYPGKIHAVEVWNEQNLDREWTSTNGLSAANYVELLHATYQTVKSIDPGVIVISGALSPTGVSDGVHAWDDFVYMDQMIDAGLLNYADCVGAHHNGINVSPDYTYDTIPNDPTAQYSAVPSTTRITVGASAAPCKLTPAKSRSRERRSKAVRDRVRLALRRRTRRRARRLRLRQRQHA